MTFGLWEREQELLSTFPSSENGNGNLKNAFQTVGNKNKKFKSQFLDTGTGTKQFISYFQEWEWDVIVPGNAQERE